MDIDQKWGLSLTTIMFLMSTVVQCHNQTVNNTTASSTLDEIVPGSLKIGQDNTFEAPDLFGGAPFSLKTNPATGEVDFQTRTVDVQTLNEARDSEEAKKVAELREDIQSRVPSAAHLPLEGREEIEEGEYLDDWGQPIKRADTEYYDEEPAQPEAREPIIAAPPKGYPLRPTTTTEASFLSLFESLFGGEEEKKMEPPPKPFKSSYRQPYPTPDAPTEYTRMTTRPPPTTTERRPLPTTERHSQQHAERFKYQTPDRQPPKTFYDPYQQVRPQNQRPLIIRPQQPERSVQREPEREREKVPYSTLPERQNYPPQKSEESYQPPPQRYPTHQRQPEKEMTSYTTEEVRPIHEVTPEKTAAPLTTPTTTTTTTTTTERAPEQQTQKRTTQAPPEESEWQTVDESQLAHLHRKENIDRQDANQNEVVSPQNDYFNFINLPVHYSNKDTAIPLISGSYANTKVQGMGASKYDKNNSGKYSNHNYEKNPTVSTKRPNYWSSTRRTTGRPFTSQPPSSTSYNKVSALEDLEYDEAAIGSGADFGGYGHKAGVKPAADPTKPPRTTSTTTTTLRTTTKKWAPPTETTRPTQFRETPKYTQLVRDTTRMPPPRETPRPNLFVRETERPATFVRETTRPQTFPAEPSTNSPTKQSYDEYEYDSFPAHVKPVANPISTTTTTRRPADIVAEETRVKVSPKPKEPDYEYYDYDTEAPLEPPTVAPTRPPPTTTTPPPPTTASAFLHSTSKYKIRYPSLSKDKIRRPEEKVEVVVPTKQEITTPTPTRAPSTTLHYFQRPKPTQEPAPVVEEDEENTPVPTKYEKPSEANKNIELVPAKVTTETPFRRPEPSEAYRRPSPEYTTEFTVGVVQGQGSSNTIYGGRPVANYPTSHSNMSPGQGQYVATSIAASPFGNPDEPFRPIARPAGISATFQVAGPDDITPAKPPETIPDHFMRPPQETDTHEDHEFIPSPQFHRPDTNSFVIGTSFNTKPDKPYKIPEYYPPSKNEIISTNPKRPPPTSNQEYINFGDSKSETRPFFQKPTTSEEPPTRQNPFPPSKPTSEEEDYNVFEGKPNKQTNVELSVDYNYDGIQTEPKPGQYVIFPKPQLNSEINENHLKKPVQTSIPHYHTTVSARPTEASTPPLEKAQETQQEVASNYPRPHWEKTGKPNFVGNGPGLRNPNPPHMTANLIPPYGNPPKYRKPIPPSNGPPIRNYHQQGLPNILPQFRPNAKVPNGRPYRPLPPNRRKENFPYRIQNEPDILMHRDFEVEETIVPKYITNRVRGSEFDDMMIQKRMGVVQPPASPRRVERTPVTTLQMLQQHHGTKVHKTPSTREDQINGDKPLVPPIFKPLKENKKDVYVVYPVKTPFNSNIKIEDPDKIEYNYNQTYDQVPVLKPSRKKEQVKRPDFPYGFVPPDEKIAKKEIKEPQKQYEADLSEYPAKRPIEIRPNIQDYTPSGASIPYTHQERIDMNLHMQSNNQWNQVSNHDLITKKDDGPAKVNPPTQYHTLMKNTNASEFTLGAVMHTLPEQSRKGVVTSVSINEDSTLVRPGLNVNERLNNGKVVTVSMPLDVRKEEKESGFQAPFQASSVVKGSQGWDVVEPEGGFPENTTESQNSTFSFENFTPELIGGFKPIYSTEEPDPEVPSGSF